MSNYDVLKKIIPPDQALANQALSRSLRQVKEIFATDLPTLSAAVSVLESNKDLNLINELDTPIPSSISNFWAGTFATGTGPGNTITTNDVIGTAAGATHTQALTDVTANIQALASLGALNSLTANGGTPSSAINGVYTVMQYCVNGAYTTITPNVPPTPDDYTITIPAPLPGQGVYGPTAVGNTDAYDAAFNNLINNANIAITSIASTYSDYAGNCNQATNAMGQQLDINLTNCLAANIDLPNIVNDPANANLVSNSTSTILTLTTQLHDIGLDVTQGGQAQFFEQVSDTTTLSGQGVIAAMREGRNIAVLNAAGIKLDTQLVDVNPNETVANNLSVGQYSVAEATANIVI